MAPAATRPTTPRTRTSCSASCCGSTRGRQAASRTVPPLQPVRRQAGARRDLQLRARATRSASPSTRSALRGRRGWRSATSARTGPRRSITASGACRRRQLRLGCPRGAPPLPEENSGTPDPGGTVRPIYTYSHDRDGSCSVTGGYVVADRHLRGLYKRYVYADFCEGELRSLVPHQKGASGERPARDLGAQPELLRRRRSPPSLRGIAGRARLPPRSPLIQASAARPG